MEEVGRKGEGLPETTGIPSHVPPHVLAGT